MTFTDIGLPARIEAKGVPTIFVAGAATRGSTVGDPEGAVLHHTAGGPNGTVPSLATCLYGRPRDGLPGPLCQVLQSREGGDRPDKAYIVSLRRANHAGKGGWNGLTGNGSVEGLEVEHTGNGSVPQHRLETAARIIAAMLEAPGARRDAAYACQHAEWAPDRKIDFRELGPWFTRATFRARVAYWIGRTIHTPSSPTPIPHYPEDDDMASYMVRRDGQNAVYLIDAGTRTRMNTEGAMKEICNERPEIRHAGRNANGFPQAIPWAPWHVDIYPPRRGDDDE